MKHKIECNYQKKSSRDFLEGCICRRVSRDFLVKFETWFIRARDKEHAEEIAKKMLNCDIHPFILKVEEL